MTDDMNAWVHDKARSGGEIKARVFGEDEAATSGQSDQKSDAPKHPKGNAGAGAGDAPPAERPDMGRLIREARWGR